MRMVLIIVALALSGCITGLSTQSFSYTKEKLDPTTGKVVARERVTGRNWTFAGPTKASAFADRNLQIQIDEMPDINMRKIFVDMGEQVDVKGGEISPELVRATLSGIGSLPGF